MSRASDRIVARAYADSIRTVGKAIAEGIRSGNAQQRADALALAKEMFPPMPSLVEVMRATRLPCAGEETDR